LDSAGKHGDAPLPSLLTRSFFESIGIDAWPVKTAR
jgi:hypothetical protein